MNHAVQQRIVEDSSAYAHLGNSGLSACVIRQMRICSRNAGVKANAHDGRIDAVPFIFKQLRPHRRRIKLPRVARHQRNGVGVARRKIAHIDRKSLEFNRRLCLVIHHAAPVISDGRNGIKQSPATGGERRIHVALNHARK